MSKWQKHEREAIAAIKDALRNTDMLITVTKGGRHTKVRLERPDGNSQTFTIASSPRTADHMAEWARRDVQRAVALMDQRRTT